MGSYLSKPIVEKQSANESNDKLICGASSMQGWRLTQEDAHNCLLDFDKNTSFFAVYDGHGGHEVAQYCSQKLPDYIKNTEAYKNGDFEKALIDGFLGFDATIVTPEVVEVLQVLQLATNKENPHDSDYSDVEENVNNLREEASMPLDKVMEKYKSNVTANLDAQNEGGKLPGSPYLCARKGQSSSGASSSGSGHKTEVVKEEASASNSSETSNSKENGSKEVEKEEKEIKETLKEDVKEKVLTEVEEEIKKDITETTPEKTTQNGEVDHSPTKENGQVSKKGKATTKTKGVPEEVKKDRLRRTAQQIYDKLLEDLSSDSEDENDKTFQGCSDDTSEDDENQAECAEDEEEDIEEEEEEEYDDEEECEEEEDCGENWPMESSEKPGCDSGCTAVVALLQGNKLFVANAGDSRCIVCRNGEAVEMSIDHKPEDDEERERINKAGGKVFSDGRVNGGLNLSRAIGDHDYKRNTELSDREQMITALPDVKTLTINPNEDEFMVLACDGIWNSMTSQEVVDFVKPKLNLNEDNLAHICEELFDNCLAPSTIGDGTGCDNMTAIIVKFKNTLCKRPASEDTEESCPKRVKASEDAS